MLTGYIPVIKTGNPADGDHEMTRHCSNIPQVLSTKDQVFAALVAELFRKVAANEMTAEEAQAQMNDFAKASRS